MGEDHMTPEELIHGMRPDEICELLSELGIEVTQPQAVAIQGLINRLGSLEAAIAAISQADGPEHNQSVA